MSTKISKKNYWLGLLYVWLQPFLLSTLLCDWKLIYWSVIYNQLHHSVTMKGMKNAGCPPPPKKWINEYIIEKRVQVSAIMLFTLPMNINWYVSFLIRTLDTFVRGGVKYANCLWRRRFTRSRLSVVGAREAQHSRHMGDLPRALVGRPSDFYPSWRV